MKGEVLVKARPRIQYDMSGKPSMYFERGGGGARGLPSKRERLGELAGGLVGVIGGLTNKHRNIGSLLGSMYAGKVQGEGIGRSIAGMSVMPGRRAELELEAQSRAKRGQAKGVERMRRRVERAEEAQDRINAPAGANTQGVVSQLRDKLRVRRTPDYMRDDFRAAEAAEAEREAQAQAKQQRRELSREDMLRARALRGMSPAQIEQFKEMDPAGLQRLQAVAGILDETVNPYAQVGPTFGELFPNAQPPQAPVRPLETAPGAAAELGRQVDPKDADHNHEGLATQLLGEEVANLQGQEEAATMGLSPEEFRRTLEAGLSGR